MDRTEARLALAVIDGLVHDAPGAERMAVEAFGSAERAAMAHAYLCGFMVQLLAERSGQSVDEVFASVRRWLS